MTWNRYHLLPERRDFIPRYDRFHRCRAPASRRTARIAVSLDLGISDLDRVLYGTIQPMGDDQRLSFTDGVLESLARSTKRAKFLDMMDQIVPWERLCKLVEPHYPTGEGNRQPIGLERMLRIYFLQQWYNLSDPGAEEALTDSVSMRRFVGIAFTNDRSPDETTICKFRHLLEKHDLGKKMRNLSSGLRPVVAKMLCAFTPRRSHPTVG